MSLYMQVPAPQWIQMGPDGRPVFAQPTGAAVFTDPINPIEQATLKGWAKTDWSMNGLPQVAEDRGESISDFIALLEKAGYPKFVTENTQEYLSRAKSRFQKDYGPVSFVGQRSEFHAYAQAYLDALSREAREKRHRESYYSDANYRAAVQRDHESRMASDPAYRAWVESMAMQQGSPEIIVQTFSADPAALSIQPMQLTSIAQADDPRYRTLNILPRTPVQQAMSPQGVPWYNTPEGKNQAMYGLLAVAALGVGAWWWMSSRKETK